MARPNQQPPADSEFCMMCLSGATETESHCTQHEPEWRALRQRLCRNLFQHDQAGKIYHEHYVTGVQAQTAIFEYIEVYYNRQRRNAAIVNIPPAEFRHRFYQRQAA